MAIVGFLRTSATVGVVGLLVLATLAPPAVAQPDEYDLLLDARAPTRFAGRVIDAVSRQPVPDAAVVLFWQFPRPDVDGIREPGPVLETLTDANGAFTFDAAAVQARISRKSYLPRLMIFKPHYTSFPEQRSSVPGVLARRFVTPGPTITVRFLTGSEDRAEAFNTFLGMISRAQLFSEDAVPIAFDLMKAALQDFGVRLPQPPPGRPR
jgi:hypothetical protein